MAKFYTSDLHFFHRKIVQFTNRGEVTTQENHEQWLVDLWNSSVKAGDLVYVLGDVSFGKLQQTKDILTKLNGQIIIVKGNHDRTEDLIELEAQGCITKWYQYKEIQIKENTAVLFHFPISSWHKQHYGSWHLHGHCVDLDTQILTKTGWKFRDELTEGESILSYNTDSGLLEDDTINEIIDVNYTGEVVICDSRSHDFNFTADHTVLVKFHSSGLLQKVKAKDIVARKRTTLLSAGIKKCNEGIGLSDDMLKLHIVCNADGSLKKDTNLCRIRVKKKHKIDYLRGLLHRLNIMYNQYESNGYQSFNFYIPSELSSLPFKGLGEYLLSANENDADSIFDAYCNSDGYKKNTSNTLIIYSAKEGEIDLLQAMFCQNGYLTNKYSRYHGFGKKLQHQLSVTKKQQSSVNSKDIKLESVANQHYWCVRTNNKTWIMRRNGVVQITGNCHGAFQGQGKILDVGIDSAYNIFGEHKLFSENDIVALMQQKEKFVAEQHRNRVE